MERTSEEGPPEVVRSGFLLEDARVAPQEGGDFLPPTFAERQALRETMPEFLDALREDRVEVEEFRPRWAAAGFRLQVYSEGEEEWFLVFEGGRTWRGMGAYLFRSGALPGEVIVQAPHSFHDRHTDVIGLSLFEDVQVRGFYFNTLHRYHASSSFRATEATLSDASHNSGGFFHLMSILTMEHLEEAVILQLHGFSGRKEGPRRFQFIISEGSEEPGALARALVEELRKGFGADAAGLYPEDTRALGATGNILARWAALHRAGRFLHFEMNDQIREDLRREPGELHGAIERFMKAGN